MKTYLEATHSTVEAGNWCLFTVSIVAKPSFTEKNNYFVLLILYNLCKQLFCYSEHLLFTFSFFFILSRSF